MTTDLERYPTIGSKPDAFVAGGSGPRGGEGQSILYDLRGATVGAPRTFIPAEFPGSTLLWVDGDGATATVRPAGFTLAATGAPASGGALPLMPCDDGTSLTTEEWILNNWRTSNVTLDPALTDDICINFLAYGSNQTGATSNRHIFSTISAGTLTGWRIFFDGGATWYLQCWVGGALVGTPVSWTQHPGMPQLFGIILKRSTGECKIYEGGEFGKDSNIGAAVGSLAGGNTLRVGHFDSNNPFLGHCAFFDIRYGADLWTTCDAAWFRRYHQCVLGIRPEFGTPGAWSRSIQTTEIRDMGTGDEWVPIADYWPRINSDGLLVEPLRNELCRNSWPAITQVTTGWTASGGVLSLVDDSAALAAAAVPATRLGPLVLQIVNATGADQYLRNNQATGGVTACVLQAVARMVVGAGARLGWWDNSAGTFTDVCALGGSYARTIAENTAPPDVDCSYCIKVPDGCTVALALASCVVGANALMPCPNPVTTAWAACPADQLYLATLADGRGRIELDIMVPRMPASDGISYLIGRNEAAPGLLFVQRHTTSWGAQVRPRSSDGTTTISGSVNLGDGAVHHLAIDWQTGRVLTVDGAAVTGAYDLAWQGAGQLRITNADSGTQIAVRVKNVRILRNSWCP